MRLMILVDDASGERFEVLDSIDKYNLDSPVVATLIAKLIKQSITVVKQSQQTN